MKRILLYLFVQLFVLSSFAQNEALVSLKNHPKINEQSNQDFLKQKSNRRTSALSLPFFDDFYQTEIYPNPSLWQDNFVFINPTYPKETVTVGVATFDGTNAVGKPYNITPNAAGLADKLTSNPINLTGLTNSDNVFLSFYYLKGDFGEMPTAPNDLFTVDFKDTLGVWQNVWQTTADSILKMRQIFIKVDSNYLGSNFQFRFQSIGNLNGANDIWNLDYVKLDKNRDTSAEKNIKEMAYEFLPPSLLKRYYVMPYNQYDTTDLADTVSIFVRNNFINTTTDIVDYFNATIVNTGTAISSFSGPSRDFGPLTNNQINYPKFNIPTGLIGDTITIKVDYHFDVSAEAGEPARVLANNTVSHRQVFNNFYAYDDGTPERGYWIVGLNNYKMAVKYGLRHPDTLQAIKLQFYPVYPDNNLATFSICVWKNFGLRQIYTDNDLIYKQSNLKISDLITEYGIDTLNGYLYAPIKSAFLQNGATFPLVLSDTFAVGLIVDTKETLVVGFDRNNNRSHYNYFVDGTSKWSESDKAGTMIINPVMGRKLSPYLTPVKDNRNKSYTISLYPNPAKNELFIDGITEKTRVDIYAMNGSLLKSEELQQSSFIDISSLASATYIVHVLNLKTLQQGSEKFVKSGY